MLRLHETSSASLYIVLRNLPQDTYKPNPWYFPHNFDIAAKEKVQQLTIRIEKKEI